MAHRGCLGGPVIARGATTVSRVSGEPLPAQVSASMPMSSVSETVRPQVALSRRGFGAELEGRRRVLTDGLIQLRPGMPEAAQPMLEWLGKRLDSLSCSIAVIGQVKSGKSTFINAFIGRPGLLPTDINPWTAAVTRLHFGANADLENTAARFTFFSQEEWQKISDEGGHLRDLTQRFVPGFEADLLRQHVVELRKRAEARLGSAFSDYLGKTHEYRELVPGLLEMYVCDATAGANRGVQNFSDIVKSADVVLEGNGFEFPTVLVDTPGTNDPLLVRDEITRRTLDAADIHIVVLIARQALSLSDVALFRILRGLHKERIVVFINRIDELDDVANDLPLLLEEVKRGLAREFPGNEIPIVAGSAYWAELALRGDAAEIAQELTPAVRAFVAQAGRIPRANIAAKVEPLPLPSDDLFRASGLPALTQALSRLAKSGHASHVMRQIADSLIELSQVSLAGARQELTTLLDEHDTETNYDQSVEEELAGISQRIEKTETLLNSLNSYFVHLGSQTSRVVDERCELLFENLHSATLQYAAQESNRLRATLTMSRGTGIWRCDTDGIRSLLEADVMANFREASDELWGLYDYVVPNLEKLLRAWQVPADFRRGSKQRPPALPPSISALGRFISLDVSEPFWKRWLALGASPDERADALRNLILREFRRVIDELVEATRAQLASLEDMILGDLTRNFVVFAEALQEQSKKTARQAMADGHIGLERQARIDELASLIEKMEPAVAELSRERQVWTF